MSRSHIANTLKLKRKDAGLTVEAVCDLLASRGIDLSKNALYNYESGYRQPDADTLMALCEIYRIDDILYTFGYKKSPDVEESTTGERVIPMEVSNKLLEALGLIGEGQELTDDDFAFLTHIIGLLEAWFSKGH